MKCEKYLHFLQIHILHRCLHKVLIRKDIKSRLEIFMAKLHYHITQLLENELICVLLVFNVFTWNYYWIYILRQLIGLYLTRVCARLVSLYRFTYIALHDTCRKLFTEQRGHVNFFIQICVREKQWYILLYNVFAQFKISGLFWDVSCKMCAGREILTISLQVSFIYTLIFIKFHS